jgi:hypothetical protein
MQSFNQLEIANRPATREGWLLTACDALRPRFSKSGGSIPEALRVSVGWPKGARGKSRAIGQCFPGSLCADAQTAIFVSPEIGDPIEALAILVHELVHAADDCVSGHRGPFKKLATAVGLVGKMTATTAGDDLRNHLTELADELGPFPHAALQSGGQKKPGSRLLKAVCPECDYTVRVTAKWVAVGLPICPTCDVSFEAG